MNENNKASSMTGKLRRVAYYVVDESEAVVASCRPDDGEGTLKVRVPEDCVQNADRIVACVNACEGLNPEAVPELLKALQNLSGDAEAGIEGDLLSTANHNAARAAIAKART